MAEQDFPKTPKELPNLVHSPLSTPQISTHIDIPPQAPPPSNHDPRPHHPSQRTHLPLPNVRQRLQKLPRLVLPPMASPPLLHLGPGAALHRNPARTRHPQQQRLEPPVVRRLRALRRPRQRHWRRRRGRQSRARDRGAGNGVREGGHTVGAAEPVAVELSEGGGEETGGWGWGVEGLRGGVCGSGEGG